MFDLVFYITNLLFFNIPLLYYYIDFRSIIFFCLFSGDIYLSLGIYLSRLFVTLSILLFYKVFETFVVLPAILLPMKPPVVSDMF